MTSLNKDSETQSMGKHSWPLSHAPIIIFCARYLQDKTNKKSLVFLLRITVQIFDISIFHHTLLLQKWSWSYFLNVSSSLSLSLSLSLASFPPDVFFIPKNHQAKRKNKYTHNAWPLSSMVNVRWSITRPQKWIYVSICLSHLCFPSLSFFLCLFLRLFPCLKDIIMTHCKS